MSEETKTKKKRSKALIPEKNDPTKDIVMTPDYLAQNIVDYFLPSGNILDPCCGEGAFYNAVVNYNNKRDETANNLFTSKYFNAKSITGIDLNYFSNPSCQYGIDFYEYEPEVKIDWIITNPPYSHLLKFMEKCFKVSDNVALLIQVPAAFFTAKLNLADKYGFGITEIIRLENPTEWKKKGLSFGTGLGVVHWMKDYKGSIEMKDYRHW